MRLAIKTQSRTEARISDIFKKALAGHDLPLPSVVEFSLADREVAFLHEDRAILTMNPAIFEDDERALYCLARRLLYRLYVKSVWGEQPEPIEVLLANREMVRRGFGDDIFYVYYQLCMGKPKSAKEYVLLNIGWLSFLGTDKFFSDTLKAAAKKSSKEWQHAERFLGAAASEMSDFSPFAAAEKKIARLARAYNEFLGVGGF